MVTNDTIYAWVAFVPGWCGSNLDPFAPEIDSTGGPTSTFEMTGLTASNLYCYAVEAWNGTTPSPLAWVNETYPAVPSNVSVVVGGSYANMTYTAPLGLVEGYELLVYPATTYPWCGFAYNISYVVRPIQNGPGFNAGPVETYLNATGLLPDTSYCGLLSASNYSGDAFAQLFDGISCMPLGCNAIAAQVNFTTAAPSLPGAPTNLVALAATSSEIDLSWTNPSGNLTDTHVYEYAGPSCIGSPIAFWDYGSSVPNLNWGGLAADTTYGFEVTASTDGGEGPPSGCANATTLFVDTPWITGSAMHDSGGTRVTSALNLRSLQVYTGVTFILIVTVIPSVAFVSDRDRRPAADDNSWMVRKGGASSLPDGNDP